MNGPRLLHCCSSNIYILPREACHKDIVNLQVEMIKQFHIQLVSIAHSVLKNVESMDQRENPCKNQYIRT